MSAIDLDLIAGVRHAYFIGIGGVGMSALARVLKYRGLQVSGSDSRPGATVQELKRDGLQVHIGQTVPALSDADLVIYSSAIHASHIELEAARKAGIRIHHRAEILSSLLNLAKTSIAVTGTHGKTTTSSMISLALSELGKNPTCLVGGEVLNLGTNTVPGNPDLWVSEVDESDKSHELYAPNYAVMTNLEEDHMDNYRDFEELKDSFRRYFSNLRNPGLLVYCEDDPVLKSLVLESAKPRLSFGLSEQADFSAQNIKLTDFGSEFDLYETGFFAGRIRLSVPGFHNITNALGVIAVLSQLGIDPLETAGVLARFRGARRRLEVKWDSDGLMVIDDYAHHPTEVRASIRALRSMGRRLTVIFQPHRYSRTRYFFKAFGRAFDEADEIILTDIYGAGETNCENISVNAIYEEILAAGHPKVQVLGKQTILKYLASRPEAGGVIAFLGAGDIGELADEFTNRFKNVTAA